MPAGKPVTADYKPLVSVVSCCCSCGGSRAYQINLPGGAFYVYGCTCHHAEPHITDIVRYLQTYDPGAVWYLQGMNLFYGRAINDTAEETCDASR